MERIVYFLGAGFSAPLGYPLMNNFLEISKDLFFKNPEKYDYFHKVFESIAEMSISKNYYDSNLFNIEEILSILEMKGNLDKKSASTQFKKYIIDVINNFTPDIKRNYRMPSNWQDFIFSETPIINHYGYFISSLLNIGMYFQETNPERNHPDNFNFFKLEEKKYFYSIITLNYDLVFETYINYLNTSFSGNPIIPMNTLSDYPYEFFISKLHGSIDQNEIIAPTWNKTLRKKIIQEQWELAYHLLSEANHIRIIGYSLPITDSYIKYLFKSAIIKKRTPHLKTIDVISLDFDGSVKKRYDDFIQFQNYRFANKDFRKLLSMNFDRVRERIERSAQGLYKSTIKFNLLENVHENFMKL